MFRGGKRMSKRMSKSKRNIRGGKRMSKRMSKRRNKKSALKGGMFRRFSRKSGPVPVITPPKKAISLKDFCLTDLGPDKNKIFRNKSSCEKDKDEAWPCKWDKDKCVPKDICGLRTVPKEKCNLDQYCVWDTSKGCITDENNVKDFNQVNILSNECGGINEKEKETCEQKEKCEWIDNTGCFNKQLTEERDNPNTDLKKPTLLKPTFHLNTERTERKAEIDGRQVIPKVYVIFLMGPSSSGKTYGFESTFLHQLREDYPDLGTVYKIDGGIMRDVSCFIKSKLKTIDIDASERLKIYENYFKPYKVKQNMSEKLVQYILDHHYKDTISSADKNSCPKFDTKKCKSDGNDDLKIIIDDEYRNKILEKSCIEKVTSVNSVESRPNNIGIVYVETFSDITKAGAMEVIKTAAGALIKKNQTSYIDMFIKEKIKFIEDTIKTLKGIKDTEISFIATHDVITVPIYCYNVAPKLYCEISGHSRGIIDGKEYKKEKKIAKMVETNVYNFTIDSTHSFLIQQIKIESAREEEKKKERKRERVGQNESENTKKPTIYMNYNEFPENSIINYDWFNKLVGDAISARLTKLHNKIKDQIKQITHIAPKQSQTAIKKGKSPLPPKIPKRSWNTTIDRQRSITTQILQNKALLRGLPVFSVNQIPIYDLWHQEFDEIKNINKNIKNYLRLLAEVTNIDYEELLDIIKDYHLQKELQKIIDKDTKSDEYEPKFKPYQKFIEFLKKNGYNANETNGKYQYTSKIFTKDIKVTFDIDSKWKRVQRINSNETWSDDNIVIVGKAPPEQESSFYQSCGDIHANLKQFLINNEFQSDDPDTIEFTKNITVDLSDIGWRFFETYGTKYRRNVWINKLLNITLVDEKLVTQSLEDRQAEKKDTENFEAWLDDEAPLTFVTNSQASTQINQSIA